MSGAFQRGRRFAARRRRPSAINVTPLVDVLFLLLIFLLLSTTFKMRPALELDLPRAPGTGLSPAKPAVLAVLHDGTYRVQGLWVSPGDLAAHLANLAQGDGDRALTVEVDRSAPAEALVFALDAAHSSGYKQVDMPTVSPTERNPNGGHGEP